MAMLKLPVDFRQSGQPPGNALRGGGGVGWGESTALYYLLMAFPCIRVT